MKPGAEEVMIGHETKVSGTELRLPQFSTEQTKVFGIWLFWLCRAGVEACTLLAMGHGGSSSGSASDDGSRGPGFDSHCRWELGFSLSLLFPIFQSVVRTYSGPSWRCNTTFLANEKLRSAA